MKTPKAKDSVWHETPLRGAKLINVAIDPSNRLVATCSDKECLIFDVKTSERHFCIDHPSPLVGSYFSSSNQIVTVDATGVMRKWSLDESDDASLISSVNLGSNISYVGEEDGSVIAIISNKEETFLDLVKENGEMEKVCDLPEKWTQSSFSVSSKLIAVCQGKTIRVIARQKDSKVPESSYESRFHIDYLKESNEMNVFESVHVRGDTVAAALTIGRIFIWSDVSTLGVNRATQSVHWHKSAPAIALSSFGGLFSGGGECVLCKWKLGKGAPMMLPRLSSPIHRLSLSNDDALIALLLDDNSVVMIDTAAMGVQTRLPTLSISTRGKGDGLMEWDPMESDMVVVGGREGCLQWIHPATSTSPFIMDVGLENGVDRDLPIYGVTQTFHSVYLSRFSRDHVVTVEEKRVGLDRCRVRVWERMNTSCSFNLLYSQEMGTRVVDISLRCSTASNPFFLLTDSNGRTIILRKSANGWIVDSKKDFSWKGATFKCASGISLDGLWAVGYSVSSHSSAIVVVDVNEMRVMEVMTVSGEVLSLDWGQANLIASCTSGVYAWCWTTFILRWRVAQRCSIKYHPILIAWIDKKIMIIDEDKGIVKESMESLIPIKDAIPFHHGDSYGILVNHSGNSFSVLLSSEIRMPRRRIRSIRVSSMETVPSSIPQSLIHSSSCLAGPVHMLPPLSLVAPSFIQSCLLPSRS
ncbi:hypothetical protein PENTCL1PPCAC_22771 [Pristionchus entomophagus]|uniref:WD40 domain-containing protein n=1 Tax=Pristionchus entomophagus TaxID=358040 RepID=A0AAV5U2C0_9BILA|nr:hypothetical protein PENTCL1PPCAC_22771 [Pristionchus entomophagus]